MASGKLLRQLIKAGTEGNLDAFRQASQEVIREERGKHHHLLANDLEKILYGRANTASPRQAALVERLPTDRERGLPLLQIKEPFRRLEDVILSDGNSSLINELLQEYHRVELLKSYGLFPIDRVLFCGPPGCGKTLTAEVIACELSLPLAIIRIDSVISSYLGETAANLRQVFDFISAIPMVVLFDEFDAIAKERADESDHGELKRVVNAFLQMLDAYEGKSLLVAATNHDGMLDSAVWRRFDEVLVFEPPNLEQLRRLLIIKLRGLRREFEIEAVRYFHSTYGCKIFNLSFGDQNKPYIGGHVKGIAYTLDTLSRELGVLFVVSSGNVLGSQLEALEWKNSYPQYLWREDWALLDPAPALNALTVGSLARYDQTINSQRHTSDPAEVPVARRDQPSPFSRRGPSVGGAIKPELVAYGGNWALNTRAGANMLVRNSLGELSTNNGFVGGHLFAEQSGTSMAAPQVAHLAARLLSEHPQADPNLLRTLLVAHATIPEASRELCAEDTEALRKICGYGRVNTRALSRSLENEVTLLAEAHIANKRHHFYEIPIPDEFVSTGRRLKEITVALAYTPYVRSTRIAYKATRIDFKVVAAPDLDHVSTMFNRATEQDDYENIAELSKPDVSGRTRGKGTVQKATWRFKQFTERSVLRNNRLFVVVTRNDHPWGEPHSATEESYALVVCLRDRENEQARLYTEIRNRLQARTRARARV